MNCWLNIYKPRGISSAKVVSYIKRIFKGQKIGHTGTLDVEAEGVLPIAIGEATKLVQFLINAKKTYIFTIKFGIQTDSGDSSGKIIATTNNMPKYEECEKISSKFIGIIEQTPPAFSALKVNGIRAYKLARQNKFVKLPARNVEIYNLKIINFNQKNNEVTYQTTCSKGTYIRTLAEDIAFSLQSLGFVIELRRTIVGIFSETNAINIKDIEYMHQEDSYNFLANKSWKIEAVLDDILVLNANSEQAKRIKYGQICLFPAEHNLDSVWIRYEGALLAIGSLRENCFISSRVFNLT